MPNSKYWSEVESKINEYAGDNPRLLHILTQVAQVAWKLGCTDAVMELKTSTQATAELGISKRRVNALAKSRNVGWQVGAGIWLFRPDDIDNMRIRTPGKPPL